MIPILHTLKRHLMRKIRSNYRQWSKLYLSLSSTDRQKIRLRIQRLNWSPKISILLPIYNSDERYLIRAIESVCKQIYPNWELCIADDGSTESVYFPYLEDIVRKDSRIRVIYRDKNGHISEASNSALSVASGEFVTLLDHDDELTEDALYFVVEELNKFPGADLIYSDEDKISPTGKLREPHFKPDWSPDLLLSMNYIGHLATFRTCLVKDLGGFQAGFEGSQDYDLLLRFTEKIPEKNIRHIPRVLYHWRMSKGSVALSAEEKPYAHEHARNALRAHLNRKKIIAEVIPGIGNYHRVLYEIPDPAPLVSIIIPTRDRLHLLKETVSGIVNRTDYETMELIIVDNDSREKATIEFLRALGNDFSQPSRRIQTRVLSFPGTFNYAASNNFAVKKAKGQLLCLLNNDMKMIDSDWLREMVSHALRPEVGAVGARLYYKNGSHQHAGVILGIQGVAGHSHRHLLKDTGYVGRTFVVQNLSAVTGACLVTRKSVFEEVGGLEADHLKVAYNDIDYCLKARKLGYRVVYNPFAELVHLESASRGSDETAPNRARFLKERSWMTQQWNEALKNDPYYNPNLTLDREDFSFSYPPRVQNPWDNCK